MNTYNDNLQQTVSETLSALTTEQTKLVSAETTAEYNLYYAQGAEITAREKLEKSEDKSEYYQHVNAQGVINDSQAINLLSSATDANNDVAASVTNVATAASNVQIASNAVALLASDIGAAVNIATASLYNTDTYKKIVDANNLINETANDAKKVSLTSMKTSAETAEIISAEVLTTATAVKTKIENLLKVTESEFTTISTLVVTENEKVASTSKTERMNEGTLRDANTAAAAITKTYSNASGQLNYDLNTTVQSGSEITVEFTELPENIFNYPPAAGVDIPDKNPNYFITLVPADKQSLLTTDQAEQLFAHTQSSSVKKSKDDTPVSFIPAKPGKNKIDNITQYSDIYGDDIDKGKEYVIFVYMEISLAYKQFIANFSDILTSPSQSFVLATDLPEAKKSAKKPETNDDGDVTKIYFKSGSIAPPNNTLPLKDIGYHCILVMAKEDPSLNFMTGANSLPIYFDTAVALQVTPSNYIVATLDGSDQDSDDDAGSSKKAKKTEDDCEPTGDHDYTITIPDDVTDNFGNPLQAGKEYWPLVISVVGGDASALKQFNPTLSFKIPALPMLPAPCPVTIQPID